MRQEEISALRGQICEVGALLYGRGYVVANDGNISVRVGENELLITPSGVGKARMTPDMIVRCDMEGQVLEGERYPSSEVKMHSAVYRGRPDVAAVVHAHPPVSTAFAVARRPISKRYLPELLLNIGYVPVADFAMPSTQDVPDSVLPYLESGQAVMLANHGVLAWAGGLPKNAWQADDAHALLNADLWNAFDKLEIVEYAANMELNVARLGGGAELADGQVEQLLSLRGYYQQRFGKIEK